MESGLDEIDGVDWLLFAIDRNGSTVFASFYSIKYLPVMTD